VNVPLAGEACFLCGAVPAVRRELVTTGRRSLDHHHHHHGHLDSSTLEELKPLCAKCIAEREAEARALLKGAGAALAVGGSMFAFTFLLPIVLCLGSAAVLGVFAYFTQHR